MHRERLLLLLDLLTEVRHAPKADRVFNLGAWVLTPEALSDLTQGAFDRATLEASGARRLPEGFCGTVACAVGHACLDPRFNAQGLWLTSTVPLPNYTMDAAGTLCPEPVYLAGDGGHEYLAWAAVEQFFDLGYEEAAWLFRGGHYPTGLETTAQDVIDRLRDQLDLPL